MTLLDEHGHPLSTYGGPTGRENYIRWLTEVRDAAECASLPVTYIRVGQSYASYQLAPIPDGWASRTRCELRENGGSYSGTPWAGPYQTREAAADAALALLEHAAGACHGYQERDRPLLDAIRARRSQPALIGDMS